MTIAAKIELLRNSNWFIDNDLSKIWTSGNFDGAVPVTMQLALILKVVY